MSPQLLAELLMIAAAFAMAAVPLGHGPVIGGRARVRRLVPDVSQPGSMLSFVALPSFLILMTLARFGIFLEAVGPVNSPDSIRRVLYSPQDVEVDSVLRNGQQQLRYPRNTAELTAAAASRAEDSSNHEHVRAIRDLAWWTAVCPAYAPLTLPTLTRALRDQDPSVKGAAAIGLGSIGAFGTPALPDLLAVRGTTVPYFDHLVAEAVLLIQNTPRWSPAPECEDASLLESRSHPGRS